MPLLDFGVPTPSADQSNYGTDTPLSSQLMPMGSLDVLSDRVNGQAIQRVGQPPPEPPRQLQDQVQNQQRMLQQPQVGLDDPKTPEEYANMTTLIQPKPMGWLEKLIASGPSPMGALLRQRQLGPIAADYQIKLNNRLHNGDYAGAQTLMKAFGPYSQATPEAYNLWQTTAKMYDDSYNRYLANKTAQDSLLKVARPDSALYRTVQGWGPKELQNMEPGAALKFAEAAGVKAETIDGIRTLTEGLSGNVAGREAQPPGYNIKDIPPNVEKAINAYNATPGVRPLALNDYVDMQRKASVGDRNAQFTLDLLGKQLGVTVHNLDVTGIVPPQVAIDNQMSSGPGGQQDWAAGFRPPQGTPQGTTPGIPAEQGLPYGTLGTPEAVQKAMMDAISKQETQGQKDPYTATNQDSGALGKYGIMPFHLPKAGLPNTPEGQKAFLNNPPLQDKLYKDMIGELATRHKGNLDKMFAEWYGGSGGADVVGTPAGDKPQVNNGRTYPSINQYTQQAKDRFNQSISQQGQSQGQPENSFPQLHRQQTAGKADQAGATEKAQITGRQATELVSAHNQFIPTMDAQGNVKMLDMTRAEAQTKGISPLSAPSPEYHAVTTYMRLNGAIKDLQSELAQLPSDDGDSIFESMRHAVTNGVKLGPINLSVPSGAASYADALQRVQTKANAVVATMNRELGSEGNELSAGMINGALATRYSRGNAAEALRSSLEASAREIIKGVGGELAPRETPGQASQRISQPGQTQQRQVPQQPVPSVNPSTGQEWNAPFPEATGKGAAPTKPNKAVFGKRTRLD